MLRHLFIMSFLFRFLISLLIVLVKVAGNLTVVFISACNCLFFSCSLLFRLHIKGSLIQIGFDKVFLLAWLQRGDFVCLWNIILRLDLSLTSRWENLATSIDSCPILKTIWTSYSTTYTSVCWPFAPGLLLRSRFWSTHLICTIGDDHWLWLLKVVNAFYGCCCRLLRWSAYRTAGTTLRSSWWQRLIVRLSSCHWWLSSCLSRWYAWLFLLHILHLNLFERLWIIDTACSKIRSWEVLLLRWLLLLLRSSRTCTTTSSVSSILLHAHFHLFGFSHLSAWLLILLSSH